MLLATKIVALVLVCVGIDGAVQLKSYQQAGARNAKKGQRGLSSDEYTTTEDAKGGRQTLGYNYPGGNGYNYVAVGADGAAELAVKIDLSLFLEKLNQIPDLQQTIHNLIQTVDKLVYYIQGGGGGGGGGGGAGGLSSQIIALEESITARIEQQDVKINALYQLIQQFQGELGTTNPEISQILAIVQSIVGGGSGGICSHEMQVIQNMNEQMMNVLTQILENVQRNGQGPGPGPGPDAVSTILETVQQTYVLLRQFTTVIEQIGQQVSRSAECPANTASNTEIQILQDMSSVLNLVESIPQKILILLQNSGVLGGSNGGLIQYVQQIMQICEAVRNEVITVKNILGKSTDDLRRYFAESQKSLTAVRKVVTETTEMVQSSAAAAISASRSLRCPTKNQKPDLDGS